MSASALRDFQVAPLHAPAAVAGGRERDAVVLPEVVVAGVVAAVHLESTESGFLTTRAWKVPEARLNAIKMHLKTL